MRIAVRYDVDVCVSVFQGQQKGCPPIRLLKPVVCCQHKYLASLPKVAVLKLAGLNVFKLFRFSYILCLCRRHCLDLRRRLEMSDI